MEINFILIQSFHIVTYNNYRTGAKMWLFTAPFVDAIIKLRNRDIP